MARRRLEVEIVGDADSAVKASKQTEAALGDVDQAVGKTSSKFAGMGKELALGLGAGAGALAAGLFVKEFGSALEKEAGMAKLGIQLGLTPDQAKEAGKLAGSVYRDAFGDSLPEVNDAVASVTKNIGGLNIFTEDQFKEITKGVLTLADAFDQDLNKTTAAAGTILKTGLAPNATAALDLITKGLQGPANKADDLLDTFIEYSTQFRQLGLTGPQALGLLQQGLQGGARDADTVADALKEFAIRAQDGSATTATAFQTIGLNADTMAQQIAGGGEPAAAALQLTFDKLKMIEDPALRAQVATGLFGTKAEDLQAALGALDVTTAVTQVGSVEGAMNNATAATETNKSKIEEWKRTMEDSVSTWIVEVGAPALQGWWSDWENGTGTVGRFRDGCAQVGDGIRFLKDEAIDPIVGSLQDLFGWLDQVRGKLDGLLSNQAFQLLTGPLSGMAGSGNNAFGGLANFAGPLSGLFANHANGGSVQNGAFWVGERGPELGIKNGSNVQIIPNHALGGIPGFAGGTDGWGTGTPGQRRYTYFEDGSSGWQTVGADGRWENDTTPEGRAKLAAWWAKKEQDNAALRYITEMGAMKQAAPSSLGPAVLPGGATRVDPSNAGGGITVIVQGSVTSERDLVQTIRSGLLQADRIGRGSL